MKKVISLLIAIVMLSTTVFADAASEFLTAWEKNVEVLSASGKITFSTKLNRPLDIFDTFPAEVRDESGIDFKMFAESIVGSVANIEYEYSCSDDYKKMDMSLTAACNVPITFNENLRSETWSKFQLWMNYDMTDINNPVYRIIYKGPFEAKYQVVDFSNAIHPEAIRLVYDNIDSSRAMQKEMINSFLKYGNITKSKNVYTVKMDEESIKSYLKDCIEIYRNNIAENGSSYQVDMEDIDEVITVINNNIDNISAFGKDGVTFKATVNNQGIISAYIEELNICVNVYDILEANGLSTKDLPREKAFIDITYNMDMAAEGFNKTTVTVPELTENNSETIFTPYNTEWNYTAKEAPIFKNNSVYYPIESMAEQSGKAFEIKKDGETITATFEEGVTVSVVGNTFITQIGEELETDKPFIIYENEKYYCVEDVLYWMNIYRTSIRFDTDKNDFVITYYVAIPEEEPEEDIEFDYSEDFDESWEYVPYYLDFYLYEDETPYMEEGIIYMPAQAFFEALFMGEVEGDAQSFTYTAAEENVFGIKTVSVKNGDSFIVVNGENRPLSNPAKEVNGVLRIPLSFAMDLGLEGSLRGNWGEDKTISWRYSFDMENPEHESNKQVKEPSKTLYIYFGSDQIPYMENGELYVPAYELFQQMYSGEWKFFENGLEHTATEENDIKIKTISAFVGDNFVTVDGKKVEFDNKIVNVNDIIRIPISFTEKMGMEVVRIVCEFDFVEYSFMMENPSYVEKPAEASKAEASENWLIDLFSW